MLVAADADTALTFIEFGAVSVVLAVLARLAGRLRITPIPLYLLAGLAIGEGGVISLDLSEQFISVVAEIGVLMLLLALGLAYSADELRAGMRTSLRPGALDAVVNFTPGFVGGLLLGWEVRAALLLGGVCWISSSGIISKVLADLDRLANLETPAILNLLVVEDLAMAVYLPIAGALITGRGLGGTAITVAVALAAVGVIMFVSLRLGHHLSAALAPGSDESLLLAVFGLTLLVGGLAQQLEVSAAIGAFLVGLAVSGPVQRRAGDLVGPLRDLFAALFFLFFSVQIDPGDVVDSLLPAALLAIVILATKALTGWLAASWAGAGRAGRWRAAATLGARGEFSIVIAALGGTLADGPELGAVAAAVVLITAVVSPVAARVVDTGRPAALAVSRR